MAATDQPDRPPTPWPEDADVMGEGRFMWHAILKDIEADLIGG